MTSLGFNAPNRQDWEVEDFPILCQTCLGENPYVRMTKEKYGKECKICARPFTVFRWCPGVCMRFKKTQVCQTCSQLKNVCQTCLLGLRYGLPVQVCDAGLSLKEDLPKSEVNKEYHMQNVGREISNSDGTRPVGVLRKPAGPRNTLLKLARTKTYYKRNRPRICSFWVKGECKRGEECLYPHEKPIGPDDPLAHQNIQDRYYGVQDPVANKLLTRASTMPSLDPPEDKTITTFYVGGLGDAVTATDLRDCFSQFGETRAVTVSQRLQCALVQFATRQAAEVAADVSFKKLIVNGQRLHVRWGKDKGGGTGAGIQLEPVPGLPGTLPPPPPPAEKESSASYFNPPPGGPLAVVNITPPSPGLGPHLFHPMGPPPPFMRAPGPIHYPAHDPQRMGAQP